MGINNKHMKDIRKIFTVVIHNKEYDVYDLEKKEHPGYNDTPKTWWLYYADRLPEGTLPAIDSDSWEPWNSSITRLLWDVEFRQSNSSKEKWNETRFSNHTRVNMYCNKKLVYAFSTWGNDRGMSYAMAKVQYLQTVICEHPYNFLNPEEMKGRKIYWYGLPATIQPRAVDGWEITVYPDYTTGISKAEWWKELRRRETKIGKIDEDWDSMQKEDNEEEEYNEYINWGDALSDGHIDWFRQ